MHGARCAAPLCRSASGVAGGGAVEAKHVTFPNGDTYEGGWKGGKVGGVGAMGVLQP